MTSPRPHDERGFSSEDSSKQSAQVRELRGAESSNTLDWSRELVLHTRDLLCIHDLKGQLLSINPEPARLLGYSVDDLLCIPMREMLPPEFRPQFDEYLQRISREGEAQGLLAITTRSGEKRIWEYHNTLHRSEGAEPVVHGIAHDVTDRLRAEKALCEANQKLQRNMREQESTLRGLQLFRTLLDHSNDAIEVIEPGTMRLLDVNAKASEELGYTREELLQMKIFDIDPELTPELLAQRHAEIEKNGFRIFETIHRRKDGTTFPVEVNLRRVQLDREYMVAVTRNISERKRAAGELRQSEEQIRLFIEHAPAALAMFDRDMRYLEASRRWRDDFGLGERALRGISHYEVFPDIPERWKEAHRRALAGEVVRAESDRFDRADGSVRWTRWEVRPWHDAAGEIGGIMIFSEDITKVLKAKEALAASESRFRVVFDKSPVGISLIDKNTGRFLRANQRYCELVGRTEEELKGLDLSSVTHPDDREAACEYLRRLASGKISYYEKEKKYVRPDGSIRWVHAAGVVVPDVPGEMPFGIGIVQDITARKEAEEALRASEESYRNFVAQSSEGIFRQDVDAPIPTDLPEDELAQRILRDSYMAECNDAMVKMYGLNSVQDFLGKRLTEFVDPNNPRNLELTREYIRSGFRILERESHETDIHGNPKVFRNSMIGIVEGGKLTRTWGIQREVTEQVKLEESRRAAEQALHESEERLRLAQEVANIGTFDRNLLTGEGRWTPQTMAIYGLPADAAVPNLDQFVQLVHPEDRQSVSALLTHSMETGEGGGEWRIVWPDGTLRWIAGRWRVFKDSSGKPERMIGIDYDITDRKRIEEELRQAKEKLTEEKHYLEHAIDTEMGFEEIIGISRGLKGVMEQAAKVAPSDAAVLLLGETGVGKELVARAIHRLSSRKDDSFIKMNCAAIPSGLLESELFGAEKGAYTGSVSRKIGRLELADKGTIFLDEIGEIALALQPKLLRVLQDQEFERLGGTQTLKVNFRLIAATNRDLAEEVRHNQFRSDLFCRLNVFPIHVPALRERRDDIPLLIEYFVKKIGRRLNKHITSIPRRTLNELCAWDWPGNVRELENFIERSLILSPGSILAAPLGELQAKPRVLAGQAHTLEASERKLILEALRLANGRISGQRGAAVRLGLKRTTLQSKLKQMGINPRTLPPN